MWEHIRFSGIGIDLAAVDDSGQVYVYSLMGALGKMPLAQRRIEPDEVPRTELDAVVGLHWLPVWPTEFKVCARDIEVSNKLIDM